MIARFAIVVVALLTTSSAFAETLTAEAARRFVAGTLRVRGESVCASLQGIPFEPCFNLDKTNDQSFRGSVSGFGFAYCDFTRRVSVAAGMGGRRQPSAPVELGTAEASAAAGPN